MTRIPRCKTGARVPTWRPLRALTAVMAGQRVLLADWKVAPTTVRNEARCISSASLFINRPNLFRN